MPIVDLSEFAEPPPPADVVPLSRCCLAPRQLYRHHVLDYDGETACDRVRTYTVVICTDCRKPIGEKGISVCKSPSRVQNATLTSKSKLTAGDLRAYERAVGTQAIRATLWSGLGRMRVFLAALAAYSRGVTSGPVVGTPGSSTLSWRRR